MARSTSAAVVSLPTSTSSPSTSSTTAASTTSTAAATTTTPSTSSTTSAATSSPSPSSASTSATSSSSSQSSSATPTPVTSQSIFTSGGTVVTVTQVVTPTTSPTSSQNNTSSSNSFFSNTKAVAGVFTVVGLVVVAIAIALIVNAIKRRRAQKFDRDVAEAAAEAAASSRSPFDDYAYANSGVGAGGGGYGYSENSHGTYQMPPLQPNDAYGMTEMSQYDPYAAAAAAAASLPPTAAIDRSRSRKESEPGTPGIAGVGARGLAREPSKRAPYLAFAGPGPQLHELHNGIPGQRGTNRDVLEAVGLAGPVTATTVANPNNTQAGAHVNRRASETTQNTHLSRSQFGSVSSHPTPLQPGYPVESYYPQRQDTRTPDPFAAVYPPVTTSALPNPHDATLPSPSLPGHQSDHNEDAELSSSTALRSDEPRMSYQDDTDYSQGQRVLRVANE